MTVSTTAPIAQQTLAAAASSTSTSGADFNMFLKLLTTQMQNQDPLDPMKTSEYTQQLAQYSQIEQTVQQGTTLKEILARLSTQDMAQASGMIGREVVFDSAVAGFGSAPASWGFTADRRVSSAVATISDASGKVVDTRKLTPDAATGRFDWDGALAGGGTAPAGAYSLSLAAADASGKAVPVKISSIGVVENVAQAGGALALGVNGVTLPLSSLLRIAMASS
jgi:flagellar basal-body rod modification protein FlgD